MSALTSPDRLSTTVAGMRFSVTCRHCSGPLTEVNAGHADGCRSLWVGACVDCGRHWMVKADISQVPSRGLGGHR